jgi:imidazolonepropionase
MHWKTGRNSTWISDMKNEKLSLIGPFRQVLSLDNLPVNGCLSDDQLSVVVDAGILVKGGLVEAVGSFRELKSLTADVERVDGDFVVMPGLVDAHTHLCWAGTRANDYAGRLSGKTYLELARQGGGIWSTVTATRAASPEALTELTLTRAERLFSQGITTVEVKSGYGLHVEAERKMLKCIREADRQSGADLIPTCLAAHIKPRDYDGSARQYLEHIAGELLPAVKKEGLAGRVDIYLDEGAFNETDARYYLSEAKRLGFELTVHADQFTTGGVRLAVEMGARSADHLEATTDGDIELIARSAVIPVALPGASLGLGTNFAPARRLLNKGASLAIASDWNPGSAPMGNLLMQAAVLGVYEKLTMAETLSAITFRAARALGLTDRGILGPGFLADFIAFPCSDYREILYNQGGIMPGIIWKRGKRKAVTSNR